MNAPNGAFSLDEAAAIDLSLFAKLCARRPVHPETIEIPGQISLAESQLLYFLMAEVWQGSGTVVEVGTLFGKSTQAIGLGMAANPNRSHSRLFSLDFFGKYFAPTELSRQLGPLLASHSAWPDVQTAFEAEGFERAYRLIHERRPYARFHEIRRILIPLQPEESDAALEALLEECGPCAVAFIDSAKSWYTVRVLAADICERLLEGALVVWQDYRWFNSFAIPVFHSLFARHFSLLAVADNTQVFRYLGGLNRVAVLEGMPPLCKDVGLFTIERMLRAIAAESVLRNDAYGAVSAALQLAFASAECGHLDRAQERMSAMRSASAFAAQHELFEMAQQELSALRKGQG